MRRSHRLSGWIAAAAFALLGVLPLALLTYFSLSLATRAVRHEVEARISSTASLSGTAISEEMRSLTELVQAYAQRPRLSEALLRRDRTQLVRHLRELREARTGIAITFLAKPDGRLIEIVPATPSIVGKDFSFRDWYRGVTATGRPYVSRVYRTQARTHQLVVAAAAPVRDASGSRRTNRVLGILVAAYDLGHIERLAQQVAHAQHVALDVTDQKGTLVATPAGVPTRLALRRSDQRVADALRGRSGTVTIDVQGRDLLSAYAPVRGIGWTVTAAVPASSALAGVAELRNSVLAMAAILALVMLAGLGVLMQTLRARRRAEQEARRLANINRAVLDATPDGILLIDREGRRLLENTAVARLRGAEPHDGSIYEQPEENAERFTDPGRFRRFFDELRNDADGQAVERFESATGPSVEIYSAPVRDGSGELLGRIVTVRDITAELEAERLKSELVATVSHELRTPLASILGFAELLTQRHVDDDTRSRYLATIHGEAKRLTKLVNDFLDLQRIEEGSFTLALEPFDLEDVLREQVEVAAAQSDSHRLELDLPDEPLELLGERDRVAQVVANLISNAIKYAPRGGRIAIAAEARANAVRVAVEDTGIGIPADQQRKLFTKFFRVDTSDTREIGGTGLGLALCREIVEAHGGRIGFDSVEGVGSTFWFELPRPHRLNGERDGERDDYVLVVEDDPAAASLISEYLAEDGYSVEVALSGEQALGRAVERRPTLICLDIVLPGDIDGWQVLSRLKANPATADVPVIVCTGRNGRQQAAALGAADFITKPFSQRRLREAVHRLLPGGRGCVLVVDDDPSIRRLVRETLRDNGAEVREAASGEEALADIARRNPDMLVLDLIMPGVDGFAVLERLQSDPATRTLPVVVLTARRLSPDERRLLQERAVSLLDKSAYSPHELRRLVDHALAVAPR